MPLRPTLRYTNKAEQYARYRWDYAPQATDYVIAQAPVTSDTCIADIGSGTGILTRHFTGLARRIYAVEPDAEMRAWAKQACAGVPSFVSVDGSAEHTTLPDSCLDMIIVGQAIHWFEPEATLREFRRILRPEGHLAVLWNGGMEATIGEAIAKLHAVGNGWDTSPAADRPPAPPMSYYFAAGMHQLSFAAARDETWDGFFGGLCSDSHAPDAIDPRCANLRAAARQTFTALSTDGILRTHYATELVFGVLNREKDV
jgi:SAM-dependent methyltransferase